MIFQNFFRAFYTLPSDKSLSAICFFLLDSMIFYEISMLKAVLASVKLQTLTISLTVSGTVQSVKLRSFFISQQSTPYVKRVLSLHSMRAIYAGFILLMDFLSILEMVKSSRWFFLIPGSSYNLSKSSHQSLSKHGSFLS